MKVFSEEIQKFHQKILNKEKFAFSKYADGEWMAMRRIQSTPGNGEWVIEPKAEKSVQMLIDSFQYQHPDYYVGISCPCCQGDHHYDMAKFSGQPQSNLTYANLFVNANYRYYLENIVPAFSTYDNIVLVANSQSNVNLLPFKVNNFYGVGYNAWVDDVVVVDAIKNQKFNDTLFLFSCGPLGNILAHQLHQHNPNNTYIDVGSTVDKWLNNDVRNKRCYAIGVSSFSDKVCIWGN